MADSVATVRAAVAANSDLPSKLKQVLLLALDKAQGDMNSAHDYVEQWFNQGMDRVSGWYKRYTHKVMLTTALTISIGFNVNTFRVADELYRNQNLRAVVSAQVGMMTGDASKKTDISTLKDLEKAGLPIGWEGYSLIEDPCSWHGVYVFFPSLIGWLVTAFAISFGAPFWFNVLGKLISARAPAKPSKG